MASTPDWYSPAPSELLAVRMTLHFGLRGDDQSFRSLLVPQASGAWFVRQLSWAVAALQLLPDLEKRTGRASNRILVARALEALGSKLEWIDTRGEADGWRRVLGRRAFARDVDNQRWYFRDLSCKEHYVQNTRRQAAVRPMSSDRGLGLASGQRYALMSLAGSGIELAEAFAKQSVGPGHARLGPKLVDWICADPDDELPAFVSSNSASLALGPSTPSEAEKEVLARILYEGQGPQVQTRRALARVLAQFPEWPDIEAVILPALREQGREQQARNIEAARAFGAMLDATIDVALAATRAMAARRDRTRLAELAQDPKTRDGLEQVRARSSGYRDAASRAGVAFTISDDLCTQVASARPADLVGLLLARAPKLFDIDNGTAGPGDLFRRLLEEAERSAIAEEELAVGEAPEISDRTFSLEGFHELVRDCLPFAPGTS